MLKRKTDGMPNLRGQEINEVQMKEMLNAEDYTDILKKKTEFVTVTIPKGRMLKNV